MKIIIAALNSKYVHSNLAIRYIKAFAKEYPIEICEFTINENLMETAMKLIEKNPDIIGFSCYIWNIESTLKVCSILKEVKPDMKVVLGGPEVSFDSMEVIKGYDYIDYVLSGEGEVVFKQLLDVLHGRGELSNIDGLAYRENNDVKMNGICSIIEDLNIIPFPYEEEIPDKIIYYEGTRGCPFNCSYCLSSTIKGVRYFNIDRVKRELQYFIDNKVRLVKFVDRTFNANKKFAMEIWNYLIENKGDTSFHFEIAADILDDEEIELLKKAPKGLFQFEVGIQTTNIEILKNINRIMDFNKVKRNVVKLKEETKIHCHLDLIAGLPGENMESFRRSLDMCMDIMPDVLQLGFLKVLKGSPIYYSKEKYGLHYINYPPYQVLYTKDISIEEMQKLIRLEDVFETYYNSGIFRITMEYLLSKEESKFDFFMEFCSYLNRNEFFKRNLDLKDKFKLLCDFIVYYKNEKINDILLHDYVITTKKSSIPDFMKKEFPNGVKELLHNSRSIIIYSLGNVDFKRLLCMPVSIKVYRENGKYKIEQNESIAVFNLRNGEYCYI